MTVIVRKKGMVPGVLALVMCNAALAEYRSDDHTTLQPMAPAQVAPAVDVAPRFAEAFRRSGQPRVVLMWNRALNDQAHARVVDEETIRERGRRADNSTERTTQGSTETARLKEGDSSDERNKTVSRGQRVVGETPRDVKLSERNAAMLMRSFVAEMNRGGVRFIDRALVMRNTAAMVHRQAGDPQMLEIDALRAHAELLLEVLMVEDADAPAGYGFDVRAKDIRRGEEVTSLYSRAVPPLRSTAGPGAWVPGSAGYEYRPPAPPPSPSPADVGAALARDVMLALGGNLPPHTAPAVRK